MEKKRKIAYGAMFAVVAAVEFGFGYYMAVVQNFMQMDAVSRVANAFYVLFSRDPHLGSIGFIWNPLPSFLEIGLLALYPIFPILASQALAGVILTSLFAGWTALILYAAFIRSGLSRRWAVLLIALYGLHPFIFLYGSNAMTECIYSFFLIWLVLHLMRWYKEPHIRHLVMVGLALAFAFLIRYEAITLGMGAAFIVIVHTLKKYDKDRMSRIGGILVVVLTPPVFAGIAWMFLNYSMMGDPLYFYRSEYSNLSLTEGFHAENEVFAALFHQPLHALLFVLKKTAYFLVPLLAILAVRVKSRALFRFDFIALVVLLVSTVILQWYMLMTGSSFGFLRFFHYPLPVLIAWFAYEYHVLPSLAMKRFLKYSFAVMLVCSAIWTGFALNNSAVSEDSEIFHPHDSITRENNLQYAEIADVLDGIVEKEPHALILLDTTNAFYVVLKSRISRNLIITNDRDFKPRLQYPVGKADYILVTNPEAFDLDAVNAQYPDLFRKGADWAKLVKDFDGQWRLYRVEAGNPS